MTVLDLITNNDRTTHGKRLPACCYGANNKLEALHSSSKDEDGSWQNPHAHFTLETSTDANMVDKMSHSLWDSIITMIITKRKERERWTISQSVLCIIMTMHLSFYFLIVIWPPSQRNKETIFHDHFLPAAWTSWNRSCNITNNLQDRLHHSGIPELPKRIS